jgi:hypothetical protein
VDGGEGERDKSLYCPDEGVPGRILRAKDGSVYVKYSTQCLASGKSSIRAKLIMLYKEKY